MRKIILFVCVLLSVESFAQANIDKKSFINGVKHKQIVNADTIRNTFSKYHPSIQSIRMMNGDINRVQWLRDIELARSHRQMAKNWDTASDICFGMAGAGALICMFVLKDPIEFSEQVPGYRDYKYQKKVNDRRRTNHWIAGTFTSVAIVGGLLCGLKARYHKNQLDFHISPYEVGIGLTF